VRESESVRERERDLVELDGVGAHGDGTRATSRVTLVLGLDMAKSTPPFL
jgi:hypothetical protein